MSRAATSRVLAVVPVRAGVLPAGGAEAVAEADGRVLLAGEAAPAAAASLSGVATEVRAWETDGFAPGEWAARLAPLLTEEDWSSSRRRPTAATSPLAAELDRPLLAGAMRADDASVTTIVHGGRVSPSTRSTDRSSRRCSRGARRGRRTEPLPEVEVIEPPAAPQRSKDATVEKVLPPDITTMDLSEAPRILGGGAGLDGEARLRQLGEVATLLGAAMGATRVLTDRGWLDHSRQIGTTGVVVDPDLYLAFGISGAVQHTAGLGQPDHVISVNVDPHCPMMELADLAIVADANETVAELHRRLGGERRAPMADFDAIVVGADRPSAAALELAATAARCACSSGPLPGSKNMYGGVVYGASSTRSCRAGGRVRSSAGSPVA